MLDWFKRFATPDSCVQSVETESPTAAAEGQAEGLLERLESFRRPANEPAQTRVIVVASQKGGTGKTTVAAHLGVEAAIAGQGPTVLIDTDPQGSLSEWWEARDGYLQCDGISALVKVSWTTLPRSSQNCVATGRCSRSSTHPARAHHVN